jgi:hypothetical protein
MKHTLFLVLGMGILATVVWAATIGDGHGSGAITVSANTEGAFDFYMYSRGDEFRGVLFYYESAVGRRHSVPPKIRMKLDTLAWDKHAAMFAGPCTLDGNEARAKVKVIDNRPPSASTGVPDMFSIVVTDSDGKQLYVAEGPLVRGDISIRVGSSAGSSTRR